MAHVLVLTIVKLLFRFDVEGAVNVPSAGAYIVVANHLNWLDSFALLIALPQTPRVHFIGWSTVLGSPRLSRLIRIGRVGFIPIERDVGRRSNRRRQTHAMLEHCLNAGYPLVLFPEGQVGCAEGELGPLHSGFARLASITGAPILPIALAGTRRLWLRKRIRVVIGPVIAGRPSTIDAVMERTRAAMLQLMPSPAPDDGGSRLFERKLTMLIPSLTNWEPADF